MVERDGEHIIIDVELDAEFGLYGLCGDIHVGLTDEEQASYVRVIALKETKRMEI